MAVHSWVEIRELIVEQLTAWLDLLKQLDLAGELRELAELVADTHVDADLLGVVVLYMLPLVWFINRWRRGGPLEVLGGIVRLFVLLVMFTFAVVALLGRLEGRSYRW